MNGPPHLLGEVSNTSKTAQLKELRRFLFKRKFIWETGSTTICEVPTKNWQNRDKIQVLDVCIDNE